MKFLSCFYHNGNRVCVDEVRRTSSVTMPPTQGPNRPRLMAEALIPVMDDEERIKVRDFYENYFKSHPSSCITTEAKGDSFFSYWKNMFIEYFLGNGASAMGFYARLESSPEYPGVCLRLSGKSSVNDMDRLKALTKVAESSPFLEKKYRILPMRCNQPCPWTTTNVRNQEVRNAELAFRERNPKYLQHVKNRHRQDEHTFAFCPKGTTSDYFVEVLEFCGNCTMNTFLQSEMATDDDVLAVMYNAILGLRSIYEYTDGKTFRSKGSLSHSDPNLGNLMITRSDTPFHVGSDRSKSTFLRPIWTDYVQYEIGSGEATDLDKFISYVADFSQLERMKSPSAYVRVQTIAKKLRELYYQASNMDDAFDVILDTLAHYYNPAETKFPAKLFRPRAEARAHSTFGRSPSLRYTKSVQHQSAGKKKKKKKTPVKTSKKKKNKKSPKTQKRRT